MVILESPFGSERVIIQHISKDDFKSYFVGFNDLDGNYRLKELVNVLQNVIPEFAFGFHAGEHIEINKLCSFIREAARSIYRIDKFEQTRDIYVNGAIPPSDTLAKKYLKNGEFGELILHLLLRDFHKTIPLLSKIFFKDSRGATVHGFDAVHVQPESKTLWLGEAKLYTDGEGGIRELVKDIKNHFVADYLEQEFALISKKVRIFDNIPKKNHWLDLMAENAKLSNVLQSINIPLLCTYTSDVFSKYNDEKLQGFIDEYEKEVNDLKEYFDDKNDHPWKTNLNIILLLFPIKSKNELVAEMHRKLFAMQMM